MVGAATLKAEKMQAAGPAARPSAPGLRPASAAKGRPPPPGASARPSAPSSGPAPRGSAGPSSREDSSPKAGAAALPEAERDVRKSSDEYMNSAAERMMKIQGTLKKKKSMTATGDFDYDNAEAAEESAMSMLDLLASLESSGQTELGIFSSSILQYSKDMGIRLSPEAIAAADPEDNHGVLIKCEGRGLLFEDDSGTFVADHDGVVLRLPYGEIKLILWDHQHSSVKIRARNNEFVIICIENSLELEQELTKRFAEAIDHHALTMSLVPSFSYLGMFAGPTKPKPFERKRANLTQLKQSKMPALTKAIRLPSRAPIPRSESIVWSAFPAQFQARNLLRLMIFHALPFFCSLNG